MENKNLELYNKYKEVPQNAMKPFDNGRFKGTDINTMWRIKCLTESFGVCGIGWYQELVRTWVENTPNGEQYAFAEIKLYIKVDGEWSKGISGTGGNKLAKYNKNGELVISDEAFKMAITDAFGVACKYLGIGADVYWENDRTKYTADELVRPKTQEELDTIIANLTPPPPKDTNVIVVKSFADRCECCGNEVNEKVAKFSKDKFGKILCYNCQKKQN